jgi:hypothetical protein
MPRPDVARAALSLRATHLTASAREVLDLVLQGRSGAVRDFGAEMTPGSRFALLVAEAIDGVDLMPAWSLWTKSGTDPTLEKMLSERWRDEILPKFAKAYGLTGARAAVSFSRTRALAHTHRRWAA